MKLHSTTVIFVTPAEDSESLNQELESSGILNNWPVYIWSTEKSTENEQDWYEKEYEDGD